MCKGICPQLYTCFWYLALWVRCWHARLLREIKTQPITTVQRALVYGIEHKCLMYDMIWFAIHSHLIPASNAQRTSFILMLMVFFSNSKCISPNWNHMLWLNHRILGDSKFCCPASTITGKDKLPGARASRWDLCCMIFPEWNDMTCSYPLLI